MRAQLRRIPPTRRYAASQAAIDQLERQRVSVESLPAPVTASVCRSRPGLPDRPFAYDPARLIAAAKLPVLIVQGDHDLQIMIADANRSTRSAGGDAEAAARRQPLKPVIGDGAAANVATYGDAGLGDRAGGPDTIAAFGQQVAIYGTSPRFRRGAFRRGVCQSAPSGARPVSGSNVSSTLLWPSAVKAGSHKAGPRPFEGGRLLRWKCRCGRAARSAEPAGSPSAADALADLTATLPRSKWA